ncbi:hypothetical protein QBC44DRAFT_386014 [Cladorrhinum sp. PSN332]|nr:hypothetical protein QBC44DRAFT_386014 [Cladorrhinum sp. PSN332]
MATSYQGDFFELDPNNNDSKIHLPRSTWSWPNPPCIMAVVDPILRKLLIARERGKPYQLLWTWYGFWDMRTRFLHDPDWEKACTAIFPPETLPLAERLEFDHAAERGSGGISKIFTLISDSRLSPPPVPELPMQVSAEAAVWAIGLAHRFEQGQAKAMVTESDVTPEFVESCESFEIVKTNAGDTYFHLSVAELARLGRVSSMTADLEWLVEPRKSLG